MKLRKIGTALTLALLLLFCLALPALGAGEDLPVFVVQGPEDPVGAGETFDVTVDLNNNPGFYAFQITLAFDREAMECTKITYGPLLEGTLAVTNPRGSKGAIVVAATAEGVFESGSVAVFQFKALTDHPAMAFSFADFVFSDSDGAPIPAECVFPAGSPSSGSQEAAPGSGEAAPSGTSEEGSGSSGSSGETPAPSGGSGTSDTPAESTEGSGSGTGSEEAVSGGQATPATEAEAEEIDYPDIQNHWAREDILKASKLGLFKGYDDGRFGPNDPVTRVQLVTLLYRLSGSPDVEENSPFQDIAREIPEFRKAISWAYAKGYIHGRDEKNTIFDPRASITRQEAMTLLFNFSGGKSGMETMFTSIYDQNYTDSAEIASWAKKAVYWGVYSELIKGTTEVTIEPNGTATRAQMARLLVNYIEKFMN